jgi:hypothetical protein
MFSALQTLIHQVTLAFFDQRTGALNHQAAVMHVKDQFWTCL